MDMIFEVKPNPDAALLPEARHYIMSKKQRGSRNSMNWAMSLKDLIQLAAVIDELLTKETTPRCYHCDEMVEVQESGTVHLTADGKFPAKMRCDPARSGKPYGLNAYAVGVVDE